MRLSLKMPGSHAVQMLQALKALLTIFCIRDTLHAPLQPLPGGRSHLQKVILHECWWCRTVDEGLASEIREFRSPTDSETRMFYEIVIAPGYTLEGLAKLKGKSKTLRILEAPLRGPFGRSLRQVAGAGPHITLRLLRVNALSIHACTLANVCKAGSSGTFQGAQARQGPGVSLQVDGCTSMRTP